MAGASLLVTAGIALVLGLQRAAVANAFEIQIYRHLVLFQDFYTVLPFMAILAAALFAPAQALGARAALWCGRNVWSVALLTAATLAVGTHSVYHSHPLSLDEFAVVFQSRIFAEGSLTGHFPPSLIDWLIPKPFQGRFIKVAPDGEVLSIYWPGFSLLLAPFSAAGATWLLNPLIGGATIVLMHRIALALFGNLESAGYVSLLTLASPAVTINALSYYAMPAHLLANALFMLLLLRPAPLRALAAGLVGSFALVLHNPVPHLLFALPWIAWLAFRADRIRLIGALLAGYLPLCVILGWGWAIFVQNLGSGTALGELATPAAAAGTLLSRPAAIFGWNPSAHLLDLFKLWLWAVPGLLSVAALGAWRLRASRGPWLAVIGSALLTYIGYFIVKLDQGHGWGFRYFHSAWLVLPLLAAAALNESGDERGVKAGALPGYLAACAVFSITVLTTFHALQVEHFISRHLAQLPAAPGEQARVRMVDIGIGYYSWDLIQNDPFLRDRVVTLASRGPQNDRAMMAERFPQYRLLSSDRRGSVWGVAREDHREQK